VVGQADLVDGPAADLRSGAHPLGDQHPASIAVRDGDDRRPAAVLQAPLGGQLGVTSTNISGQLGEMVEAAHPAGGVVLGDAVGGHDERVAVGARGASPTGCPRCARAGTSAGGIGACPYSGFSTGDSCGS
jgi:hypothetical protein